MHEIGKRTASRFLDCKAPAEQHTRIILSARSHFCFLFGYLLCMHSASFDNACGFCSSWNVVYVYMIHDQLFRHNAVNTSRYSGSLCALTAEQFREVYALVVLLDG